MRKIKYKCLVLDHDDTIVNSTATVHYPSYLITMESLRNKKGMTLEEYFKMNANQSIYSFYKDEEKFTDEEMNIEYGQWKDYVSKHIPECFEGIKDIINEYVAAGGIIVVCTTNNTQHILRDFKHNGIVEPQQVYDGRLEAEKQKPNPFPVLDVMEKYNLNKEDILVVDDLHPGMQMAINAGVDFVAACWCHNVDSIREGFINNNVRCLTEVNQLQQIIFE